MILRKKLPETIECESFLENLVRIGVWEGHGRKGDPRSRSGFWRGEKTCAHNSLKGDGAFNSSEEENSHGGETGSLASARYKTGRASEEKRARERCSGVPGRHGERENW